MIKKFADFFKNGIIQRNKKVKDVDELVEQLMDSINSHNYKSFIDSIDNGADINAYVSAGIGNLYSPFISCLMHKNLKFAKILIDRGVDLFKQPISISIDEYMKISLNKSDYDNIMEYILKKYPNFMEDLEIRKKSNKYNL